MQEHTDERAEPPNGQVVLQRLALTHFRNIAFAALEPAPRLNLIFGENGHGKTSLIEALYVLLTTRSFRTSRLVELVEEGHLQAELSAKILQLGLARELRAQLGKRKRDFLSDGKRPKKKLHYALSTPVIAFHPGDLLLTSGPASSRRSLLDRILVYLDPAGAEARLRFTEALRERQRVLADRGGQARELDAYEGVLAAQGVRFARARARAAEELMRHLKPVFTSVAAAGLRLEATYRAGGSTDQELFGRELRQRRAQDLRRGAASFGPQRDELELVLSGRLARTHASQGQQRILALALKVAELHCVRAATGLEPLLLLDDVSSELDPSRTAAVFRFLSETRSQMFVTTTRPELFREVELGKSERADFQMVDGHLLPR